MLEPTARPSIPRGQESAPDESAIRDLIERMAQALTHGDTATLANLWIAPSLIVAENHSRAVSSREEIERFFNGAQQHYHARGIVEARPEIERIESMSPSIALVWVRWPYEDVHGHDLGEESSMYVVRQDDDGHWKLCTAVARGSAAQRH